MHLPERHAHLLEYIFLFDAGADQIGLNLFDELLELIPRDVVIDQRAVLDVVRRALIVVVVAELVTGADDLHAEILVGADHVTRAQSADEQHDLLARETRFVFVDHGLHERLVLRDDAFGALLDSIVEVARDAPQRFLDLTWAEEVVFDPGNPVFLFHVARNVVHRSIAMQHVELGLGRRLELGDAAVAGPLCDHAQAHFLEQNARGPGVSADVVVADDRDVVGRLLECRGLPVELLEDVVPDRIVGDMMAKGLGDAAESFAAYRHDRLAVFLRLRLRDCLDVVADEADRAFGLNRNALIERKQQLNLIHDLVQLLVAAKHDVVFLEVGRELHRDEGVDAGRADVIVAPRTPGILAASHGAVADMDHVLDRAPDDAFGSGVGAAADRHDAGNRLDVGFYAAVRLALFEGAQVLGAALRELVRICFEHLVDHRLVAYFGVFRFFLRAQAHGATSGRFPLPARAEGV